MRIRIRWSLLWWMIGFNIIRLYEYSPERLKELLTNNRRGIGEVTGYRVEIYIFIVQISIYPGRRQWNIKK